LIIDKLNKAPGTNYSLNSDNVYNYGMDKTENILYTFDTPKFVMSAGVISDYTNLYMGTNEVWKKTWGTVNTTVLTPTQYVPEMCAIHYPETLTAEDWFTNYLPEVLNIHAQTKSKPTFLIHPSEKAETLYKILAIPDKNLLTKIIYNAENQYYASKTFLLSPKKSELPCLENITLLRSLLPPVQTTLRQQVVLIGNETLATDLFTAESNWDVTLLTEASSYEKRYLSLLKADLVIGQSDSDELNYIWLLKSGATVIEIMDVNKPVATHFHLAGASNIKYAMLVSNQTQTLVEDVKTILKEQLEDNDTKVDLSGPIKPTIILPSQTAMKGMYSHSGDTFREMVEIWEQRDYCTVIRSDDSPHVWWGKIGDTLLYDRPTMRWLQSPSYKLALFGNAMPENPTKNQRPWSFWPRSPKQVELIAKKPLLSWSQRTCKSVFIGKIENGVQLANRTKADWSKVIENFYMPIDSTGGPYKYSQTEYLELIGKSRYGLCLPGFGPKCNRDIEYFATGTVPIVVPGVDMTNYAVPPVENVHYFSVKTPEEITKIINDTSPEKWATMSIDGRLWWQQYASAEGLFNLTAKLVE
jgi:hypothetical protein